MSDGSSAGTRLLLDLAPGPHSARPREFTAWGAEVFFVAADPTNHEVASIWRSDGTRDGTTPVVSGPESGWTPSDLTVAGGQLYFVAGGALWTSNGTSAGTRAIRTLPTSTDVALTPVGDQLALLLIGPGGRELWTSDGTSGGTRRVRALGMLPRGEYDPYAGVGAQYLLGVRGNAALFAANVGALGGELWSAT